MDTLICSQYKPFFSSTGIFQTSNLPENHFSSKVYLYSKTYSEVYPTAKNLSVCYPAVSNNKMFYGIDWVIIFVFLTFILLTYIKVLYVKVFYNTITSLTNFQIARQFINEKSGVAQKTSFLMYILFWLNISLYAFTMAQYFEINFFRYKIFDFLFLMVFVLLFYSTKILLYRFIGYLIDKTEETNLFLSHFGVFFKNLAIVLTPLTTAALYIDKQLLPYLLGGILIILILFSFLRIYRAIKLSYQMQYSLFYIFLYLCTVEIVPIIYSTKVLKMWV